MALERLKQFGVATRWRVCVLIAHKSTFPSGFINIDLPVVGGGVVVAAAAAVIVFMFSFVRIVIVCVYES